MFSFRVELKHGPGSGGTRGPSGVRGGGVSKCSHSNAATGARVPALSKEWAQPRKDHLPEHLALQSKSGKLLNDNYGSQ